MFVEDPLGISPPFSDEVVLLLTLPCLHLREKLCAGLTPHGQRQQCGEQTDPADSRF